MPVPMAPMTSGAATLRCMTCFSCFIVYVGVFPLQDMRLAGCPLSDILAAGQWRSSAFMRYLDEADLEKDVALAAAIHSEDEEWID